MAARTPLTDKQKTAIKFKAQVRTQFKSYARPLALALRNANKRTILAVTSEVAEEAKRNVAVDSGRLRDSIQGKARKARGEDRFIGAVSTNTKGAGKFESERNEVKAGKRKKKDMEKLGYGYGMDQEVGHASGNYTFKPYLRPALKTVGPHVRQIIRDETKRAAAEEKVPAPTKRTRTRRPKS